MKTLFLINRDWRDIFRKEFDELYKKLERDQLLPKENRFVIFSFANETYSDTKETISTIHRKIPLASFKPWPDVASCWIVVHAFVRAVKKGKAQKPDAIITYDFGFVPAACITKKLLGGKVVMILTNMPRVYSATRKFGSLKSVYSALIEKAFSGMVDEYLTINDVLKNYLLNLGVPEEKIHLFTTDTINRDKTHIEKVRSNTQARAELRSRLTIPQDAPVLISIARLEAEKGFERLINLFATLDDSHWLIILGQGSLEGQIVEQAKKLGVHDRLIMPGFVNREDIWNYYAAADAFVLLSKAEALGVVVWEAMYMGLPVIGSTAEGIVESTGANKERGWVLRDDAQFKHLVSEATGASAEREEMLNRAKQYVEEKIQLSTTINDIV